VSSRSKARDVGFISSTSLSTLDPGPDAFGNTSGNGSPVEIFSHAL
jgi:hypothetical protein